MNTARQDDIRGTSDNGLMNVDGYPSITQCGEDRSPYHRTYAQHYAETNRTNGHSKRENRLCPPHKGTTSFKFENYQLQVGKCFRLRDRIDIARANQKPLFTYRGPITGCFRHSHQTLYARCNTRVQFVFDSHQTLFARCNTRVQSTPVAQ